VAGKPKAAQPAEVTFVAYAGGYGLTEDGRWVVLPEGHVPAAPADLQL